MIAPNSGESPDEYVFYCLFCEKVTTFRIDQSDLFEGHMKRVHKVVTNVDTAIKVNFLKKEKKNKIVDLARAVAKKGQKFLCGLCSDSAEFVLDEIKTFRSHMEISHDIYFEIGTFLALNLTIQNDKSETKSFVKTLGTVIFSILQDAKLEGDIVDQIHGNTSVDESDVTPESEHKDIPKVEDDYHTDLTVEANTVRRERGIRKKQIIVKRYNYNSCSVSKEGTFENKFNQYKCSYCSFVATNLQHNLKSQIRIHMKKMHYVCTVCEVKFSSGKELNVHFDSDHKTDGKQVKCSIGGCTSQLTYDAMIIHVQAAHKGEVFLCNLSVLNLSNNETETCGKKYAHLSSFNRHKEESHIKEAARIKPKVTCTLCGILLKAKSLRNLIELAHGK